MPRTRSLAWSELKLGVVTIVAVVIAGVTIVMLTGERGFFWQQYGLKTRFPNVAGLKKGSPVRVAGIAVGTVRDWTFVGNSVEVSLKVNKDVRDKITDSSLATLGSISLLGESSVDITPASGGTPIPEWGYVPPGRIPAQIADVADQASQGVQELSSLVHDIHQGKGTVGKLMTDDGVYIQLQRTVTTLSDLAEGIKQGRGSVGKLLSDRATADELDRSLKNIETLTAQLNSGEGSLGKLLKDDSFARSLSATTDSLDALVAKINRGEGTAGKLLTDTALYNRMDSITQRLDQLVERLNDGEGTAGRLLKDKQLYENMNKVTSELAALIVQIEQDPKKYLNVKVSIFKMARHESAGAGSVVLAFLLGAVGGAIVALLYAPATGERTREFLGEKAREGRDRAADAVDKGREAFNQSRETLSQAIERGREAYQQARERENA